MKRKWGSFFLGMVTMALIIAISGTVLAAGSLTDLKNVMVGGIKIVVDGSEIHPTDANGKTVDPIIYNGTTFLPVRAVASSLGKAVYWDGPNYTVYLGNMNGKLEYPTVMMKDMTSISDACKKTDLLTDNYGNRYSSAVTFCDQYDVSNYEYLLNMKYSFFKGTLYIPQGDTSDKTGYLTIIADGRTIYTSPEMTKTSAPVDISVNVTGYNDVSVQLSKVGYKGLWLCLADAGFYQ